MIFCTTKRMCDQLSYSIAREFRSAAIHGDKRQQERDYVLNAFKTVSVLLRRCVGPDVVARKHFECDWLLNAPKTQCAGCCPRLKAVCVLSKAGSAASCCEACVLCLAAHKRER